MLKELELPHTIDDAMVRLYQAEIDRIARACISAAEAEAPRGARRVRHKIALRDIVTHTTLSESGVRLALYASTRLDTKVVHDAIEGVGADYEGIVGQIAYQAFFADVWARIHAIQGED